MPTFRYCQFCEIEHLFNICLDRDTNTYELWCSKSGLRVETITEQNDSGRFLELTRQFIPPPPEDSDEEYPDEWHESLI